MKRQIKKSYYIQQTDDEKADDEKAETATMVSKSKFKALGSHLLNFYMVRC